MTITVTGPDNSTFEFPDGTSSDTITGALNKHYGQTAAPAAAPRVQYDPSDSRFSPTSMEAKQLIRGLPVIGPLASERGSAALTALAGRDTYAEALAKERQAQADYQAQHPVRSQLLQGAGGVLGYGGAAMIPGVGEALGMAGPLKYAVPLGAASNAAIGAADAAARGQSPTTGAIAGGLAGAAGPVIGKVAGMGLDAARGFLRTPTDVPEQFLPQTVAGVRVPVSASRLTNDLPTAREEQTMLKMGVPTAVAAEDQTNAAMRQAHTNLEAQLNPQAPPGAPPTTPLDAANRVTGDLVSQEQQRAAAEINRMLGASAATQGLGQQLGGGAAAPLGTNDMGSIISQGIQNRATAARQATRNAYTAARGVDAAYNQLPTRGASEAVRDIVNSQPDVVRISPRTTPAAHAAIDSIDEELQIAAENAARRGEPLAPADMEQVRRALLAQQQNAIGAARGSGNYSDVRAIGRVIDAFDTWEDRLINTPGGLMRGDPRQIMATRLAARAAHAQERAAFGRQGPGDKVGTFMGNVIGRFPGQEMGPEAITKHLFGTPDNPISNDAAPAILAHLRDNIFGPNSQEWNAIKHGVISHLTEPPPGADAIPFAKQAQRFDRFLGSSRHANAVYSPAEQAQIARVANNIRNVQDVAPRPGTVEHMIADISGRLGRPSTGEELLRQLQAGGGGDLAAELQRRLSPQAMGDLKVGMWNRITEAPEGGTAWEHQKVANNIAKFLQTDLAQKMYTPNERLIMREIGNAHEKLIPLKGSVNYSNTAYTMRDMAAKSIGGLSKLLFTAIGLAHGHPFGGMLGDVVTNKAKEAIAAHIAGRQAAQRAEQLFLGRQAIAPLRAPQAIGAGMLPQIERQSQ